MSNTGENGQIILKIVANSFTPNGHGVSAYITKKFKERQCASGYTWKYVDQEMKDFYYKEFLKTYTWEPGHEVEFKETWNLYCRNRYKALLYKWRNKKTRPFHVPDEIWDAWKEKWAEEQWQRNSAAARNNINSDLTGKHIGGSRSTIEHAILMEDTLQRPPDSWELFRTTHQRKDGSFVDLRAQAIDAQMVERLSQASQESIEGGESHTPTHDDINKLYYEGPATWRMLYGMDVNIERSVLLVADNFGYLYSVDMRSNKQNGEPILIHKKGSKVVGLHCNPVQPDLLSCGNDHFARIWDARRLNNDSSLASLAHGRVVNSAYFSPLSGNKILTTSQDNRIRVWDSIFGNFESPSREIVHSHDFNRHLTPFRAEWDPKDPSESLAVIGRYISENYDGVALHPIDFIDTSTGKLVAEVMDTDVTTITPVNKLHPHEYILASGSSRTLLIWKTKQENWKTKKEPEKKQFIFNNTEKKRNGKVDGDSDGDSALDPKGRQTITKKCQDKCTKSGTKKS